MDEEEAERQDTVEDSILHAFQRLGNSKKGMKFSLTITISSFILHVICYSTNGWIVNGSAKLGLWSFCNTTTYYECCKPADEFVGEKDWLGNSRSCMSVGLVVGFVSVLSIFTHSCFGFTEYKNREIARKISFVTSFIVALVKVTGVSIYGTRFKKEPLLVDFGPSLPLIGSVMSGSLFFACGIVIFFEHSDNKIKPLEEDSTNSNDAGNAEIREEIDHQAQGNANTEGTVPQAQYNTNAGHNTETDQKTKENTSRSVIKETIFKHTRIQVREAKEVHN